ncbi:MAG: adenylyl-sulfate kinase [Chthoniobacterales bacterium]|jgi:bifunctional enzyme CysN/CysC
MKVREETASATDLPEQALSDDSDREFVEPLFGEKAFRVVIVGHVDHGKSTLVGRLLYETGSLPEGKYEEIQTICRRRNMPFEWAFLMDALQAERDQNITIDVSQIWFHSALRNYVIIDAPGHKEFLKNMVTGAATADAALLLIAANEGVQEQSRRHAYLLSLLGVGRVLVVVNKMDLVSYSSDVFAQIEAEYRAFLKQLGIEPIRFIPISARDGVNLIAAQTKHLGWYDGPALIDALDQLEAPKSASDGPLRFAVQDIYRFDERRIIAGRVESGSLRVGEQILFAPANKESTVASIESWQTPPIAVARSGQSIGITLKEQIFVERGQVAATADAMPIETNRFRARLFWMGDRPLTLGRRYKVKLLTQEVECQVASIDRVIDASSLETTSSIRRSVGRNEVAEITVQTRGPIVLDNYDRLAVSGRFVLVDENDVAGGGIVFGGQYLDRAPYRSSNISWAEGQVSLRERIERNGHRGLVVWFTGLSGAGKSTLAYALERELFDRQMHACVMDGDNLRHGLNANLSFSPEDRVENIRRAAEVAKLMAMTGLVVVTSFISPYRADRLKARQIVSSGGVEFVEVHVSAPIEVCESRDPKALYQKARAGLIQGFTGIDAPYEAPEDPELILKTGQESIATSLDQLLGFVIPLLRLDEAEYEI